MQIITKSKVITAVTQHGILASCLLTLSFAFVNLLVLLFKGLFLLHHLDPAPEGVLFLVSPDKMLWQDDHHAIKVSIQLIMYYYEN